MTTSAEAGAALTAEGAARDRRSRLAEQQRAMPSGNLLITAPAPFGTGGLGRHLLEIWDASQRAGAQARIICETAHQTSPPARAPSPRSRLRHAAIAPRARVSPSWRRWLASVEFDENAARAMPPGEHLIAFNGTALAQFSAAGAERFKTLVAANSHFEQVVRRHRLALGQYPLESASPERLLARNLAEYQLADRILYASDYIRDSFLHAGIAAEKLVRFPLTADPRFLAQTTAEEPVARPGSPIRERTTFDVVYVGSLTVHKGVPLLIDAVRSLPHQDLRLVLVGGWGSRGMRQFVEQACAEDSRITVTRGDPLPHLRAASLYVHAAYEDGFAYAAAEALAAGVPMAVSEDTGMKELLGQDAVVFPTGDLDALREAIEHAHACGAGQ